MRCYIFGCFSQLEYNVRLSVARSTGLSTRHYQPIQNLIECSIFQITTNTRLLICRKKKLIHILKNV
jgi:hypothetical protein